MRRLVDLIDTTAFWLGAAFVAIVLVFAYAHATRSQTLARTQETVREQRQALAYLCETVRVLDVLNVQFKRVDTFLLENAEMTPVEQAAVQRRRAIYDRAHEELSDTRACQRIE